MLPTPGEILAAAHRLRGVVDRTPLLHSPALSERAGVGMYLKCENRQRTGSFKLRGAYNALAVLSSEVRARGVVASSAGNHGLGVAHSARLLGLRSVIFLPSTAPRGKRDGIVAMGAQVDESQATYDDAHRASLAYARDNQMTFVNPCAGAPLLAGQGTVAVEILEELPDAGTLVVPVGGGGLVGGIAALVRAVSPRTRIVGAQGQHTNAMAASLAAGQRVEIEVLPTLADGLSGQIDDEGFETGQFAIDEMCVVSEGEIAEAIAWLEREHGMRVEGSGAVAVAAVLSAPGHLAGPVAIVVSGGNIDEARWREVISADTPPHCLPHSR